MNAMEMKIPVEYILKAAKFVKRLAYLIAAIGAVTSFGTQVDLLKSWGMNGATPYGIASTVDILAVCAAIALQIPGLPPRYRKEIGTILFVTLTVSIAANVSAGANLGLKLGHAWPVFAYMLAEFIANRARTYAASVQAAESARAAKAATVVAPQVEAVSTPVHVTATVGQKQPAAVDAKPGSAKARILELAAAVPPFSPDEIADKVGTKPGWVKHVIKTSATA
jgi:hypothetical protein